jgi:hypothetical protein
MSRIAFSAVSVVSLVSLAGLAISAAPARAGDVVIGFGAGDGHGYVGGGVRIPERRFRPPTIHWPRVRLDSITVEATPYTTSYPTADPAPFTPTPYVADPTPTGPFAPYPAGAVEDGGAGRPGHGRFDGDGRFGGDRRDGRVFIPEHDVVIEQAVVDPAIYEDRAVPVFSTVRVPIYENVSVPIYGYRSLPLDRQQRFYGPQAVQSVRVQVGERLERVPAGQRIEHVLVRPETTRVIRRVEHVAGRFVTVIDETGDRRGLDRDPRLAGDVLTREEFEREMALVAGAQGFGPAHR